MKIAVKNFENKKVQELDLPEALFSYPVQGAPDPRRGPGVPGRAARGHAQDQDAQRSRRAPGKKLWKQKGTGRARVGSIRSPLWRKGGTVHGPVPRNYAKDLSAGEKKNALQVGAVAQVRRRSELIVLESLAVPSHRTKELAAILDAVGAERQGAARRSHDNENLALASRNHPAVKTVDALAVNVYDVVDRPFVVSSEQALGRLVEVLGV